MAEIVAQQKLDLSTPLDHHDQLHRAPHGTVLYWERHAGGRRWRKVRPDEVDVAELVGSYAGSTDTYLSVNQFTGWRLVRLLRSLRAVYIDVDGCTDIDVALDALAAARMPAPSLAVYSGRGMHLYWLLDPMPAQALPVWQRTEDALIRALAPIGADARARDCTRVLRLVGTQHSGASADVRGQILTGARWSLHELADEVIGPRPQRQRRPSARVRDIRTRQQPRPTPRGSIYHRWHHVYRDLYTIAGHHGTIPPGQRDIWLFLTAVALSWFAAADTLQDEIAHAARQHTSLPINEASAAMQTCIDRAQRAAAGETVQYGGMRVDPRYRFRRSTLWRWARPMIPDELLPQLRAVIPDDMAAERATERKRAWDARHRPAQKTRAEYEAQAQQRRDHARQMRSLGYTQAHIARTLGVTQAAVSQYLRGHATA